MYKTNILCETRLTFRFLFHSPFSDAFEIMNFSKKKSGWLIFFWMFLFSVEFFFQKEYSRGVFLLTGITHETRKLASLIT